MGDYSIKMGDYSLETKHEIRNDKTGEYIEVGPDRDGLNLVEVRSYDSNSKIKARMTFTKEQAMLVSVALRKASE